MYNFKWAESIFDGYARHGVRQRPFILSRSGSAGIQRFGVAMWSGDIGSNLRSLAAHANAQMHMSLSGVDYFGSDVGGFHRSGLEGDINEVYTRWLAYSSIFDVPVRPHTDNGSKAFNTPPDRIGDVASNLANLRERYELSPYYYSLAHRAYRYGEPVFPPLVYYYQNDVNVWGLGDEKLIGRDLLAAAGFRSGETSRSVYLPAGTWVDCRSNDWTQSPGRWYSDIPEFQGRLLRLPLFARAGAIIPKMHVDEKTMDMSGKRTDGSTRDELIARVYVSTQSSRFTLFEDDGETVDFRKGAVAETEISQQLLPGKAVVAIAATRGSYPGAPERRANIVELVTPDAPVAAVVFNGKPLARLQPAQFEAAKSGWCQAGKNLTLAKSESLAVSQPKSFEFSIR
jgi:alpha-glucosidase